MPSNLSTTQANVLVKEQFDAAIQASFDQNTEGLSVIKKEVMSEAISPVGRYFAININANESYGSQGTEGGAFPAVGRSVDVRALVNYRSQFKSFGFTGDVLDIVSSATNMNLFKQEIQRSTEAFDAQQDFFLFGDGTGSLGNVNATNGSTTITMDNTVTYPYGARAMRANQVLNAYNGGGSAYRSGDMTVSLVNRSTDVATVDTTATSLAANDTIVFKNSYNYAPQGLLYHVDDSGTWLTLSRSTYPGTKATVIDASSASIDWDIIETADQRSRNNRGDASKKYQGVLFAHPVQHKALRASARTSSNLQFQANVAGTQNMDLLVQNVTPGGMKIIEDSNCQPSIVYGVNLADWAIEEVAPRQLYKHNDGSVLIQQIASSTAYGDAKEGRIYWRYNLVCKAPFRQWRIKNLNFSTSDTRISRA